MVKPSDPKQLAIDLIARSICRVQCAAVIADGWSIHSWGWNSAGAGTGEHAEAAAIRRSNRRRLQGSTIYVAAKRIDRKKATLAKPCPDCQRLIDKWGLKVVFRDGDGEWTSY